MIKLRISGYSDSKRNVWLTLPATEEQINQAFDKLLKGVPIGKTFAYHITSKGCGAKPTRVCRWRPKNAMCRPLTKLVTGKTGIVSV